MVNNKTIYSYTQVNLVFQALADVTRRAILRRLTTDKLTVKEIAKPYSISLPAISKHLKILERAHLISREKRGRKHIIRFQPQAFRTIAEYVKSILK